ncbi:DMT family transporter [Mesorhizobium sp. KR9-304]|uniref:DMT family transporter n=1 Tax=Mesorhizobium sp. KR9-304 TaxID=3156614 RepID=UPI0032B58160
MSAIVAVQRREAVDTFAVAMMIALTLSWGLNGVAAKLSNTGYSPVFLTLVRSALGGLLVFVWCRWRGIHLFERDGTLWPGMLTGLLFALEFLLIFVGLDYTSVARSTLLVNTMPFWMLVGGHLFLGERMTGRKVVGLLLAFGGLALIFSDKLSRPGPDALIGDLMSLGAGLAWAATYVVIKGTRLAHAGAEKLLLYQLAVAAIVAVILLPFWGPAIRDANAVATWSLIFQSVYIVAVTYVLWFWLVRHYPASGLASFTFVTPAFGVLFAGLILGEPLGVTIFIALLLIAGGLVLVNRAPRRPMGQ